MTAKSFWFQTGVSGDGSSTYTEVDHSRWARVMGACSNFEGIGPGYGNEFEATANPGTGTDRTVRIGTGGAIVDGKPLDQDVTEDHVLDVTPSYRRDRLVLKADWSARTVRIVVLKGVDGSETPPTVPSPIPGTTVYLQLWQVRIVSSGAVTLEVDEREWSVHEIDDVTIGHDEGSLEVKDGGISATQIATDAVETSKIKNLNVTEGKLANGAVTSGKLGSNAVIAGKINAGAVQAADIAVGGVSATDQLANDIVDDTKVGNRVAQIYRRQGGSSSNWSTYGNTTYIPTTVRIQAGVKLMTLPAGDPSDTVTITFPVAFSNVPIIVVSVGLGHSKLCILTHTQTASGFGVIINTGDGSNFGTASNVPIHWLAIGPE